MVEEATEREVGGAFQSGGVFNASDEDLDRYLRYLCTGHVPNEMVRHREMNRCQVINTVKTFRLIDGLQKQNRAVERKNKLLSKLNLILVMVATLFAIFSYFQSERVARQSSEEIRKLISLQEAQFRELIELKKGPALPAIK